MPGRHEFVPPPVGSISCCKYCGESKVDLDKRRVDGKLPPCPDAPDETAPQAGKY
jgi:hypothetical protein